MTNGPCPEKRAQKCAGDFWFVIILSGAKKCFRNFSLELEPNINLEKGAKGKIKYFEKNHCTRLKIASNTPYSMLLNTEQLHNKDSGYILIHISCLRVFFKTRVCVLNLRSQ